MAGRADHGPPLSRRRTVRRILAKHSLSTSLESHVLERSLAAKTPHRAVGANVGVLQCIFRLRVDLARWREPADIGDGYSGASCARTRRVARRNTVRHRAIFSCCRTFRRRNLFHRFASLHLDSSLHCRVKGAYITVRARLTRHKRPIAGRWQLTLGIKGLVIRCCGVRKQVLVHPRSPDRRV